MKITRILSLGLIVGACGSQQDASIAGFEPGKWSMSLHTESELPTAPPELAGIGKAMAKDEAFDFCMTPEMAADPRLVLVGGFSKADCTDDHFRMAAGAIDVKATCRPGENMRSFTVAGKYESDNFEIDKTADMIAPPPVGTVIGHMKVKARRTGKCTGNEAALAERTS